MLLHLSGLLAACTLMERERADLPAPAEVDTAAPTAVGGVGTGHCLKKLAKLSWVEEVGSAVFDRASSRSMLGTQKKSFRFCMAYMLALGLMRIDSIRTTVRVLQCLIGVNINLHSHHNVGQYARLGAGQG